MRTRLHNTFIRTNVRATSVSLAISAGLAFGSFLLASASLPVQGLSSVRVSSPVKVELQDDHRGSGRLAYRGSGRLSDVLAHRGSGRLTADPAGWGEIAYRGSGRLTQQTV